MNRIEAVKKWLDKNLPDANSLNNNNYGMILMLSTIDCFANVWGGFPNKNTKSNFCDFIINHTKYAAALKQVCPVTLYYQYRDLLPELPLKQNSIIPFDDKQLVNLANEYLSILPGNKRTNAYNSHTYIALLYKFRSKLVHELRDLGTPIEFDAVKPVIASGITDGAKVWTLRFPKKFIYDLTWEVIENYLDECNELPDRPQNLSWYD